jgi:hypothetical protein
MTAKTDFDAISHTANSKQVVRTAGADVASLTALIDSNISELKYLIGQFQAKYPSTGGDSTNYAALTSVLAELA